VRRRPDLLSLNLADARKLWGDLPSSTEAALRELTQRYRLSIARGEVRYLDQRWYVTHSGLLSVAHKRRCQGVKTALQRSSSDPVLGRWVFKATVYTARSKGFVGYGDADPSNVSPLVRGSELRIAETRAVNRALRKAYGIGLCSVEELGYLHSPPETGNKPTASNGNGSGNGRPRLRDRLCLLIRQHQLDPTLVKRYAADFCGTRELRDAGRNLVESFIDTLAGEATQNRDALICKLNSYAQTEAVNS
jgi:hypothetical protein